MRTTHMRRAGLATSARRLRRALTALLVAVVAATSATATAAWAQSEELLLVNANIVDPARREVNVGHVLIRNGVIVATPEEPPADFDGVTLDLTDKWVIPALVDTHTHTHGNVDPSGPSDLARTAAVAHRMLYAGVTALLDLNNDPDATFEARAQQRAGELGGSDIFTSLSVITAPGGHGTQFGVRAQTVTSPEEARLAVEDLALRHADVVKIVYAWTPDRDDVISIDRPTLLAAVAAAKANSITTVVHVDSWEGVRHAVEAGASAVTHVPIGGLAARPIPEDLAPLMAEKGVISIPTLTVHLDTNNYVYTPELLDSPLAQAVAPPVLLDAYRDPNFVAAVEGARPMFEELAPVFLDSVRAMAEAGVTILAGADSGSVGTIQGYSVHRELALLESAGLSRWQALAAGTTDAAAFLGRDYGVQRGDEASLLVLDASPLDDITNTQRIAYVIHHGFVVDRPSLLEPERAGLPR